MTRGDLVETEGEMHNWAWLYMSLEVATFLVFSAAMWLVIVHADTGPGAGGAAEMAAARDTAAGVDVLEDPSHADQLVTR